MNPLVHRGRDFTKSTKSLAEQDVRRAQSSPLRSQVARRIIAYRLSLIARPHIAKKSLHKLRIFCPNM